MVDRIDIGGYIVEDGIIVGCSYNNYKKPEKQQLREIIMGLNKMLGGKNENSNK